LTLLERNREKKVFSETVSELWFLS